jgi:hypothetical protein
MASPTKDVSAAKDTKNPVVVPAPNSDFYQVRNALTIREETL